MKIRDSGLLFWATLILTRHFLHLMCEYIFYTFFSHPPQISRNLRVIYGVTEDFEIFATTTTT